MPTYEYNCSNCGKHTEAFQRMSDTPLVKCPHCGKPTLSRIVSGGAGVIYKGSGWYVTDYARHEAGNHEAPHAHSVSKDDKPSAPEPSGKSEGAAKSEVTTTVAAASPSPANTTT